MKKLFIVLAAAALLALLVIPAAADVPTPWFELGYKDGDVYDVQGNLDCEIQIGDVVETTVTYDGTAYPVTAFVGDDDQEGILVNLPFNDEEEYGAWLLGGCTFELTVELEGLTSGTSGFFTCCNGGGSSLYYRNGGDKKQLQFQIGTTDNAAATNHWGSYAGAGASDAADGPVYFTTGSVLHCVGTYVPETKMLNVYLNGELGTSGYYGDGEFKLGNGYEDVLGIGLNPAYPSESLGIGCEFRVVGAKLYKVALTSAEVAEEYQNVISTITGIKPEVTVVDAPAEIAEEVIEYRTRGPVEAAASVPAPWFDLGFKDGGVYDKQGNLDTSIQAGDVVATTVTVDGTAYDVTAFVGDADQEGILINLPFTDGEGLGGWLLNGCTYEITIELEGLTEGTSGIITCCNGGGSSLYYRNGGTDIKQLQFQIGTTDNSAAEYGWGKYAGAAFNSAEKGPAFYEAGKLLHLVGTYDKATNTLNVYMNGELTSYGLYGEGEFNLGSALPEVLGIGLNPAYPSESLGAGCEFRVVGAKLYQVALTDGEVLKEYQNVVAEVTGAAVEEPAPAEPTYTYPASGESGNALVGTVIGNETGWGGNAAAGAAAAFDGNPATFFDPLGQGDGYCGMDMGRKVVLEKVAILSRYVDADWNGRFKGAEIRGNNEDNVDTAVTLWKSDVEGTAPDSYVITDFENNDGYQYYFYYNTDNHGDVAEVELYGTDSP
ncbi:MAG: hypothetical protein IKQ92_10420, partial [Clostridia bacterium]|nr:hypothetical protein [Clostridia bacterium]